MIDDTSTTERRSFPRHCIQTAAGQLGVVRRDSMAMLPSLGYHAGDYFAHWIELVESHDESRLPKIFYVNWFRKREAGRFLWPGCGENSRVLKLVDRIEGRAEAVSTPVDTEGWRAELPLIKEWFDTIGDRVPTLLRTELTDLEARLRNS